MLSCRQPAVWHLLGFDDASAAIEIYLYFTNPLNWPKVVARTGLAVGMPTVILVFGLAGVFLVRYECRYTFHRNTFMNRVRCSISA